MVAAGTNPGLETVTVCVEFPGANSISKTPSSSCFPSTVTTASSSETINESRAVLDPSGSTAETAAVFDASTGGSCAVETGRDAGGRTPGVGVVVPLLIVSTSAARIYADSAVVGRSASGATSISTSPVRTCEPAAT